MLNRRNFVLRSLGAGILAAMGQHQALAAASRQSASGSGGPLAMATWPNLAAVQTAYNLLQNQSRPLDAVEAGARVAEANPADQSVGYGGMPDRTGRVTLDACIMDEAGNAGSVTFLEGILHPISVARRVMEATPHVMLSGDGALAFALEQGFKRQNMLAPEARTAWRAQRRQPAPPSVPPAGALNHDTIGLLALDANGQIAGACSTSGLAFKRRGRIGDSPIIGAGLYVDPEVGAAAATGMGEHIMEAVGSFLIVELMRQGRTPTEACAEAVRRINRRLPDSPDRDMVGFVAIRQDGAYGAYSNKPDFTYTLAHQGQVVTQVAEWG